MDPKNRPHPGVLGPRGDRLYSATRALACNSSDFLGGGARFDRVLLRRTVHGRRELAQRRRDGTNPRADSERLWHDRSPGWNPRTTPSADGEPGWLQTLLRNRNHYRNRLGANRFDSGRRAYP